MNRFAKRLLLGLIIWAVPFIVSVLVWDPAAGGPRIGTEWFNALMAFALSVSLSVATFMHFRDVRTRSVEEGWKTGITWFAELAVIDLIVLVGIFNSGMSSYFQILTYYLGVIAVSVMAGYLKK